MILSDFLCLNDRLYCITIFSALELKYSALKLILNINFKLNTNKHERKNSKTQKKI